MSPGHRPGRYREERADLETRCHGETCVQRDVWTAVRDCAGLRRAPSGTRGCGADERRVERRLGGTPCALYHTAMGDETHGLVSLA